MKLLVWALGLAALYWLWRNSFPSVSSMSAREARRLLGLEDNAGPDAILEAHKRLIAKVHPDAGGSAELAARINQARDVLLKNLG